MDATVKKDLKTLAMFIGLYCRCEHKDRERTVVAMKTHDVKEIAGREVRLCPDCAKLLAHAFVKRSHCPMDPKSIRNTGHAATSSLRASSFITRPA